MQNLRHTLHNLRLCPPLQVAAKPATKPATDSVLSCSHSSKTCDHGLPAILASDLANPAWVLSICHVSRLQNPRPQELQHPHILRLPPPSNTAGPSPLLRLLSLLLQILQLARTTCHPSLSPRSFCYPAAGSAHCTNTTCNVHAHSDLIFPPLWLL